MKLLDEVARLGRALDVQKDVGYTCETAGHFYMQHVLSAWEIFLQKTKETKKGKKSKNVVSELFPFKEFFNNTPIFSDTDGSFESEMEEAKSCWNHIQSVFVRLEECRAFEILKGSSDRQNYMVTKQVGEGHTTYIRDNNRLYISHIPRLGVLVTCQEDCICNVYFFLCIRRKSLL